MYSYGVFGSILFNANQLFRAFNLFGSLKKLVLFWNELKTAVVAKIAITEEGFLKITARITAR